MSINKQALGIYELLKIRCTVIEGMGFEVIISEFEPKILGLWAWANYLISLKLQWLFLKNEENSAFLIVLL